MKHTRHILLSTFFTLAAIFTLSACEEPKTEASAQTSGSALQNTSTAEASMGPALDHAFRRASRFDRIQGLTEALAHLDAHNIDAAIDVFETEHWWLGDIEIELFMEAWTRFDPPAALDYAARWPDRVRRPTALAAVVRGWALRDPQAANEAVGTIAAAYPKRRQLFVENLLSGWVQSGQPGLLEYVASLNEAVFLHSAVWIAGGQTRRLGVPAVLDWLDGHLASDLPDKLKLSLFLRVTGMASRLDPARVAAWHAKYEGQEYTRRAGAILAERWIPKDPDAAMSWIATSIPEEERRSALRTAFTKWTTADFEGVGAWVEKAPTAEPYDPAFRAYALVMAQRDPAGAIPWAERIVNEESRRTALTRVASAWYRRDAEAAESWLSSSELDEKSLEQVRNASNRKPVRPLKKP
jgi:hypothetical protein